MKKKYIKPSVQSLDVTIDSVCSLVYSYVGPGVKSNASQASEQPSTISQQDVHPWSKYGN